MCGIFGTINLDKKPANSSLLTVTRGIELLRHRGPDGSGIQAQDSVCFGHTRLSIIDIEGGHQPMWNYRREGLITYNGELYNFQNLRQELQKSGCKFNTHSDTEVALNAYLEWGRDCLKYFRGMFAFAAVDFKKKKALIARDRIGIKPLFYTIKDNSFYFSSELEPLYKTLGPFELDLEALDDYLNWQYISAPKTIYQEVKTLPPASFIEIDLLTGKISQDNYWKLKFSEDRSLSVKEWEKRLDQILREVVKIHLVSDVPFGAFLSGGIDSSLVTGYMADIMEQPVNTFSIGFVEEFFSELPFAKQVSDINHTKHFTEIVKPESLSLLPLLVSHYGQPFADSSAIPTYYVSKMARKHVKMVLSGDGGDENFAGYNSYEYVIKGMNRSSSIGSHLWSKFKSLTNPDYLINKAYNLHCCTAHHFPQSDRENILNSRFKGIVRKRKPERESLMQIGGQPTISRLQNLDLMAYLPFDILTKVDIASMASSLEVRVPLLDHVLIETAATIPAEFKLREEKINDDVVYDKKHILKQVAKRRYPDNIISRQKMGFGVPLGKWFANELKPEISKRLLESDFMPVFFDKQALAKIVENHTETFDCSAKLWNLLFLEEWMKTHHESLPA